MPRQKDPAWQYVSEVPGESENESPRLQCQFCKGNFTTTITRMKSHLGKIACRDIQICQCVPDSVVNEVREHIAMATTKKAKRSHIFGSSAGSSSTPMGPSNAQAQQLIHSMFPPVAHNTQSTIYTLVKKKEKEETDNRIMEAIVDCCLPFNVLWNKSFQLAIEKVASNGSGYKLPSFETARTKLLGGLKERADEYVKNVGKNWEMTGCTVMSDGWTDRRNRPHLNLLVASLHGTVFVKSICTTGKRKDANYIADFIIGAIEEHIGANNVVQVIADNASNYTVVGVIIERKWPHLFKTNCVKFTDPEVKKGMDEVFRRMVLEEGQDVIYEQFGHYFRKSKEIFDKMALQLLTSVHPRLWWEMCENTIPYVRDVAIKLLSQPCSASACERTWSAFEATHTKKRNRLGPSKLHDLVYVKLNLSLQKTSEEKLEADSKPIYIDHIVAFPDGVEVNELDDDEDVEDDDGAEDDDVDTDAADVDPFAYLDELEVE